MKAGVLYSGGKDSSLMAVILDKLGYQVELVTINFSVFPSWKAAALSAKSLGFSHRIIKIQKNMLQEGVEMILQDGFPNRGINHIHSRALHIAAEDYSLIADGTRRDDRIPILNHEEIQSLEDSKDVEYINLAGFGHKTINMLSERIFKIEKAFTNMDNNSDYEVEIRYQIDKLRGIGKASLIFPAHLQSRVIGWRENE